MQCATTTSLAWLWVEPSVERCIPTRTRAARARRTGALRAAGALPPLPPLPRRAPAAPAAPPAMARGTRRSPLPPRGRRRPAGREWGRGPPGLPARRRRHRRSRSAAAGSRCSRARGAPCGRPRGAWRVSEGPPRFTAAAAAGSAWHPPDLPHLRARARPAGRETGRGPSAGQYRRIRVARARSGPARCSLRPARPRAAPPVTPDRTRVARAVERDRRAALSAAGPYERL